LKMGMSIQVRFKASSADRSIHRSAIDRTNGFQALTDNGAYSYWNRKPPVAVRASLGLMALAERGDSVDAILPSATMMQPARTRKSATDDDQNKPTMAERHSKPFLPCRAHRPPPEPPPKPTIYTNCRSGNAQGAGSNNFHACHCRSRRKSSLRILKPTMGLQHAARQQKRSSHASATP
jgi:hypothetical protein